MPIPYTSINQSQAERQKAVNQEVTAALPNFPPALTKKGLCAVLVSLGYSSQKAGQFLTAADYGVISDFASKGNKFAELQQYAKSVAKKPVKLPSTLSVDGFTAIVNTVLSPAPQQSELGIAQPEIAVTKVPATPINTKLTAIAPTQLPMPKKESPSIPATPPVTPKPVTPAPKSGRVVGAASLADILGLGGPKPKIDAKWQTHYKVLTEQRTDLRETLQSYQDPEITRTGGADVYDMATASVGADQHYKLFSQKAAQLQEVEAAIKRIERGVYGTCLMTGKAIEAERLAVNPATQYSIEGERLFQAERSQHLHAVALKAAKEVTEVPDVGDDDDKIPDEAAPAPATKGKKGAEDPDLDEEDPDKDDDLAPSDVDEADEDDDLAVEEDEIPALPLNSDEDLEDQKTELDGFTVLNEDAKEVVPEAAPKKRTRAKAPRDLDR